MSEHRAVTLSTGQAVCVSDHAKARIAEMRIDPRATTLCLTNPDEVTEPNSRSKYRGMGRALLSRGDLTLVVGPCGDHTRVVTALPRTQDKWLELAAAGILPDDRRLKNLSHLPTRADVARRAAS